ncbi:MAG: capsule biosynthesis protein CapI [Spirochaetes bacterium RBG_16_49_21]|nr:MAG: capsule biosynthesis protein CapI [Spirochaetes bacterium RBG_16_49_21]
MKILVTGTAGFIGFHLAEVLAARGDDVVGLDNISDYYDVRLKHGRLAASGIMKEEIQYNRIVQSAKHPRYRFIKLDLMDHDALFGLFDREGFSAVCNLAAQAGVRYSLQNPYAYINSNIVGFINILEACRNFSTNHLVFASSSSVYGLNEKMPFRTSDNVDHPVSLYGATKKSNELMAHAYSYLYRIPATGLRFFTVYGPWGRPDMAPFLFTRAIIEGKEIDVYNRGDMQRDFTYIGDIIDGIVRVIDNPPKANPDWNGASPDPGTSPAPYVIYNIGKGSPVKLLDFIELLEKIIGKKARKNLMAMQPGDVVATYADVESLARATGFAPATPIDRGIGEFVRWYKEYADKLV